LERALPTLAQLQLPLLVHAELEGPILSASQKLYDTHADWRDYKTYLASRPDEAELQAIRALIELCRTYKFRLHIVHLATALALPEVAAAKAEGLPLTVETCPHYLHLTAEQIPYAATQCKCAPPIRSEANREALWQGLRDGIIDLIATDHSPCLPEMKQAEIPEDNGRFDKSWGGIASLSTALPVVWTEAQRRGFTLEDIARWLSEAPAKLAGIHAQAGSIEVGKFANLTLFDPEAHFIVTPEKLHYRHPISPYMGETLRGEVKATVLHGEIIYENQIFPGDPKGRDLSGEPR
jgi:allantoinase